MAPSLGVKDAARFQPDEFGAPPPQFLIVSASERKNYFDLRKQISFSLDEENRLQFARWLNKYCPRAYRSVNGKNSSDAFRFSKTWRCR